ncbi:tetratricopeptide repeat protein [Mameliella sediminis]|uniref:tetratricopeptide repeat protein n=1 Tax=Mameliella sediminis TaxID=2836866 RepID=UPI001C46946C|nr:tetratricopeptide repeat protein [Mameliella sediminis]MBY6116602.1 tetratricopeptide repeat protein [Antarctobacter heliothermus]MBY6146355.1 tetratricopeptide repeat protein [Mameliella alba]MBV7396695.1 tetratricopeptide repeat protein [Mameliella sediminis]MBY6162985.1 tetratricopeptide repeat protein [Mameliella alba]MBY6171249.1 tetratricopeptide repeat protein [Mameliella alba]
MRHPIIVSLCAAGVVALSACDKGVDSAEMDRKFQGVNVVDESDLNEVMLTVGDPNEAVTYFQRTARDNPERIDVLRGLAQSLVRAKRIPEARVAWAKVVDHKDATEEDKVHLADVLIRAGEWDQAEKVLDAIPPTHETFKRYRLEAMIADGNKEWKKADSFYEVAVGLTTKPGSVLNNWGYSKLTRGDFEAAEKMFLEAIRHDDKLYTAKNNLVMARGAQGKYTLPVIPMTQVERAELLHTLGLAAIKSGDVKTGKALLREALETHPQHFEAAARALAALDEV